MDGHTLLESGGRCQHNHYAEQFAYGYNEVYICGREYYWSYTETDDEFEMRRQDMKSWIAEKRMEYLAQKYNGELK